MTALVLYIALFISEQFGAGVAGGKTLEECLQNRAELVERINEHAPQLGDRVYVEACKRVELEPVQPTVDPKNGA